jgi:IMP and pyridine-specific 5'-nucleotidase
MKSMLQHSFVLDALETTGADTFRHFEVLIDEHREFELLEAEGKSPPAVSRLKQLVPTIGSFHTPLPLREAFELYNEKHRLTKRRNITISFNEIRHIMNLAQILAFCENRCETKPEEEPCQDHPAQLDGPRLISFDGDQTLYSDGANFDSNPRLANYLYQLLRHGVAIAVVTAAGYEYNAEKYEYRLSGLLHYFKTRGLTEEECARFYLFGGECNYLLQLGSDYRLHPVKEFGPGGWCTSTRYLSETPGNWSETEIQELLDVSEKTVQTAVEELKLRGRVIRKRRSVGLIPNPGKEMTRESLDETVLRVHEELQKLNGGRGPKLPYCAFNGGSDAWVDVGNKRVGVQILQAYLGIPKAETLHIGDQFLNTGNDFAARDVSPCVWIISPQETTYILKSILRFAGVKFTLSEKSKEKEEEEEESDNSINGRGVNRCTSESSQVNFEEVERRRMSAEKMDVYTGEMVNRG